MRDIARACSCDIATQLCELLNMSSPSESRSLLHLEVGESTQSAYGTSLNDNDDPESISRKVVERNLLRKLDFRTAYLVLIYILNQVRKASVTHLVRSPPL